MIIYPAKNTGEFTLGGKADGLVKLREAGIAVPDFFVIPAESLTDFALITENLKEHKKCIPKDFFLPESEVEKIEEILKNWGFPMLPVIVRSSIADEDGQEDSFAGLMDSFSNIRTMDDLMTAVANCAASAFGEKAISYRNQKNLTTLIRPAVIVQQQKEAMVSGVIFSVYPQYPAVMAVHSVWGLGNGLVDGELNADEFYMLKEDGISDHVHIASKDSMIVCDSKTGVRSVPVPAEKQKIPSLSESQLNEIFTTATSLERVFSRPLDIEFLIADEKLFIVQARPITQSIPKLEVFDNSNIQESYCGVTTPLTFSFAQRAYATVYRQTMRLLSIPRTTMEQYEPVVNNLLGLVKGRIYYNINNWYLGLKLLPSFRQNKDDMERMMGLEKPVNFIIDKNKTLFEKIKVLPSLIKNLAKLLFAFTKRKKSVEVFLEKLQAYYVDFYSDATVLETPDQILLKKKELDRMLLDKWTTPIINDFYLMMINGKVRRSINSLGIADADEFLSRYFAGNLQVDSAQQAIEMQLLAAKSYKFEGLKEIMIELDDDVHSKVKSHSPEYFADVVAFISKYGDRTIGELKLETTTMRLSPKIFYSYLKNLLLSGNEASFITLSKTATEADGQLKNALGKTSTVRARKIHQSLKNLQQAIQYRESMRLERTRLFGMYRTVYLAAAKRFVEQGMICASGDIFYLTENEINALLNGGQVEVMTIIAQRKAEFRAYVKENVPGQIILPEAPYKKNVLLTSSSGELHGTGCVGGIVEGEVIVIEGPEDDLNVRGKIICALRTDPGWVALFPTCKAVLIEKGSALSHSVILLREFNIPAIINIAGLTQNLASGMMIRMNGSTGSIEIIDKEKDKKIDGK